MKKIIFVGTLLMMPLLCLAQLDMVRFHLDGGMESALSHQIEENTSRLLSLMNSTVISGKSKLKYDKSDDKVFTKDGMRILDELWATSAMMCPVSNVTDKCLSLQNGGMFQIRNIPVTMLAADEDSEDEELVVCFNSNGQIDNVMIALEEHRYVDVISAAREVEELYRRQAIVDFVENFRTAYNRKDIDFINSVFSNNALIITGKVVKVKNQQDLSSQSLTSEEIQYQKSTKEEYITNLKKCFRNNSYINVVFEELEVMRHPKRSDVFGVTMKQHWNSSNYSDVGYLFIMINFEDEQNPCIQVRTWQPDKYNGKPLPREEIFTVNKFNI